MWSSSSCCLAVRENVLGMVHQRSRLGTVHSLNYRGSSTFPLVGIYLGLRGEKEDDSLLNASEWWIRDLAQEVGMPWLTLRDWTLKGWVHGRQTNVQKLWILWADEEEV